jgi:hypothetical protein
MVEHATLNSKTTCFTFSNKGDVEISTITQPISLIYNRLQRW